MASTLHAMSLWSFEPVSKRLHLVDGNNQKRSDLRDIDPGVLISLCRSLLDRELSMIQLRQDVPCGMASPHSLRLSLKSNEYPGIWYRS